MNEQRHHDVAVGVFPERTLADRAVDELVRAGFRHDQIGVVAPGEKAGTKAKGAPSGEHALAGAATGAAAGAAAGGLVGLGILAGVIPVLGPVIAGGTLAVILANAAGGAAIAGVVGGLVGLGIPEDEAKTYESDLRNGRTLITVKAANRYDEACTVLRRLGATNKSVLPAAARV
jgi:hypothetical protein